MAGDGNYGGNGSVWWEMRHTTSSGRTVTLGRATGRIRSTANGKHWFQKGNGCVTGHDPQEVQSNGSTKFRVALRFSTSPVGAYDSSSKAKRGLSAFSREQERRRAMIVAELDRIAAEAKRQARKLRAGGNEARLRIRVPAINRPTPPEGSAKDPWEINVHW